MGNILFSTTRQWNCGDEFILFGIRRLLNRAGLSYNPVIYNRHPSITPPKYHRKHRWSRSRWDPLYDNSFFLDDPELIDYVIFAGTPEWFGGARTSHLLEFIGKHELRCAFIGVGVHRKHQFSGIFKEVVTQNSDIITARDPLCYELVKDFPNSHYRVCPALFSGPRATPRKALDRIGIVIQAGKTIHHAVPENISKYCQEQFSLIENTYDTTYIAHYIDDLKIAVNQGKRVLYSGYSEDYIDIYRNFDFIISTRVHGCGLASSLGIPNIYIPHDGRYATTIKFNSIISKEGDDLLTILKHADVQKESRGLCEYRSAEEKSMKELLKKHLSVFK